MNKVQLDDLKQFITKTVSEVISQAIAQSETDLRSEIAQSELRLRNEMRDGFAGVAEVLDELNIHISQRDNEVERRLSRLEQRTV